MQGAGIYRTNQNGFTQVHKLGNNIIYRIAVSAERDGDKIAVAAKDQNVKHWIIELNENGNVLRRTPVSKEVYGLRYVYY